MSSFEEKHAAWIDGRLSSDEEAAFLVELEARGFEPGDKAGVRRLGALLREYGAVPALKHAEFFNHQLMERIAADDPVPAGVAAPREWGVGWLWRMAFAGVACILASVAIFRVTVPKTPGPVPDAREYVARILDTETGDGVTAVTYQAPKSEMTIVWLEGLEYVPKPSAAPAASAKP